jgi:hypothetical protein
MPHFNLNNSQIYLKWVLGEALVDLVFWNFTGTSVSRGGHLSHNIVSDSDSHFIDRAIRKKLIKEKKTTPPAETDFNTLSLSMIIFSLYY